MFKERHERMNDPGNCLLRIREAMHVFTPKELQLANFILKRPDKALDMSIDELAEACDVSISTVVRLCKTLNYSGYKELIRNLYMDIFSSQPDNAFEDITPGTSPAVVMRNVCQCNIRAIENTLAITDTDALTRAVEKLCAARRIDFYGVGSSGLVALDAGNKFVRCGKTVLAHSDLHNQVLTALTLGPEDVAVLISYSGETTDILNLANRIRPLGATLISLTRYGRNSLSEMADIRLYSSSTETLLRIGPMSSRIAQLTIIDMLYAAVCSQIYDDVKPYLEKSLAATMPMHQHLNESKDPPAKA